MEKGKEPKIPSILLESIPQSVYDMIIDKQAEMKKKGHRINLSQAVVMLIKEGRTTRIIPDADGGL